VATEPVKSEAAKNVVEGGLGLAAVSRYAVRLERSNGGLVVLDVAGFVDLLKTPGWLPQAAPC
jgi:DNA-binding transcriptional LysR family regulator